jgi:formylglycine-generating enzyme required for sulfatase activity
VRAGTAELGCTASQRGCEADEEPAALITLTRDFELAATETTQAQFESLMGYNPSRDVDPTLPVDLVSWHEAAAYANALSALEGLRACYRCTGSGTEVDCWLPVDRSVYDCVGYRLPTEAEWEFAARCGLDNRYSGAAVLDAVGWYRANSGLIPQPVASKRVNGCGLYDMSGNVWEWVHDAATVSYLDRRATDPEGPASSRANVPRMRRGGSWYGATEDCRVANRGSDSSWTRFVSLGFRVARTAP